jgi:hypothetical protein
LNPLASFLDIVLKSEKRNSASGYYLFAIK